MPAQIIDLSQQYSASDLLFDLSLFAGGASSGTVTPTEHCNLPIACMQAAIEATLSGTVVIKALTQVRDAFGGQADTYSAVGTASCRFSATGRIREYNFADGVRSVPEFRLTIPAGTALYGRNRVVSNGYTYEVLGTNAGETGSLATRALCVRIDG